MDRKVISESVYEKLPEELSGALTDLSDRGRDMLLLACLSVLSNCFPKLHGIYDDDKVYPHLYALVIAPAASGKGIIRKSISLINKIHQFIKDDSKGRKDLCIEEKKKEKKGSLSTADCPEIERKIVTANISSSSLIELMHSSQNGITFIESEADTMGNMLSNDWSNYSDILRKAFHHEPVSISRKLDNLYLDVEEPRLSMIMSGTPGQLQPLIKSPENGLFSRFIFYTFDEVVEFKQVFDKKETPLSTKLDRLGDRLFNAYVELNNRKEGILFSLTSSQQERFINRMREIQNVIEEHHSVDFLSVLFRHGLICFKAAMVLSALRNLDNLKDLHELTCDDQDFDGALELIGIVLHHSQYVFEMMTIDELNPEEFKLLSKLGERFSRADAVEVGKRYSLSPRTIDYRLRSWLKKGFLIKLATGRYLKVKVKK